MSRRTQLIAALALLVGFSLFFWRSRPEERSRPESDDIADDIARGASSESQARRVESGSPFIALSGQSAGPSAGSGVVEGIVLSNKTSEPEAWVDIVFRQGREEAAITSGEDGRFRLELASGTYEMRAIGQGVLGKALAPVRVRANQSIEIEIRVTPLVRIRGQVVDGRNRPLSSVDVLLRSDTPAGKAYPQRGEVGVALTDSMGRFELEVPPGAVDLELRYEESVSFPSAQVPERDPPQNLRFVLDLSGALSGRVLSPSGVEVSGADVLLSQRRSKTSRFEGRVARTDASGSYSYDSIPPGEYVLEALELSYGPSAPTKVNIAEGAAMQEIELRLTEPVSIKGTVVDASGRPLSDVAVAQVWYGSKQKFSKVNTFPNGSFEFLAVGPGPHMVRAQKEGYAETRRYDVKAPIDDLTITLKLSAAIEGTVTDPEGSPVERYDVALRENGSGNRPVQKKTIGTASGFSFENIPEGSYILTITGESGEELIKAVKVPGGETLSVELSY